MVITFFLRSIYRSSSIRGSSPRISRACSTVCVASDLGRIASARIVIKKNDDQTKLVIEDGKEEVMEWAVQGYFISDESHRNADRGVLHGEATLGLIHLTQHSYVIPPM